MSARILVVDDIATNLHLLEARLRAEYYEVASATSGPAALQLLASWRPDVVLLDVMMPGMDGYEVCARIKGDPATSHIPVVMITAMTEATERVRGLQAGADDFLSKPVDHATLFARLRALLRTKQAQDALRIRGATAGEFGLSVPAHPGNDVSGTRALVVTESRDEAREIDDALAADGVQVTIALEPAAAWRKAVEGGFDLVVLSLSFDAGDGLRFASRLRANEPTRELPVVLIADLDQRNQVLRGFDLGANDHALRPLDPNELRARARNQLRRKLYQDRLREELQRSLEEAVTDGLTGLRNRRYADRHLEMLLQNGDITVLLLDIDHFKQVNDTHGHACGDAVLKEVAQRLRNGVRTADVVARYGGEEFLVIMPDRVLPDLRTVAERLRQVVCDRPVWLPTGPVSVTISIGGARSGQDRSAENLVRRADEALYEAKRAGRNRFAAGRLEAGT
ncbi:PleD family two-component system response regulator [Roseomonas elaeocarpi]|uniref:diguanylate cyclase n=1 Tax=Roseomonas elaeocarpi TaxID=907779 RepID=A0ABV6JXY7_9PROT